MSTRRDFLSRSAVTAAGLGIAMTSEAPAQASQSVRQLQPPKKPVIVTRQTRDNTVEEAYKMLLDGADTLDAAHHICLGRENDPDDHSVGYGGLPNEDGVVELDACCMHGPTRSAGSVGAVKNIRNVCLVSRKVMERTGHVMLVGDGAERFAVAQGFKREDLLTEDARKIWLLWKENNSNQDWWGPGMASPQWKDPKAESAPPVSQHLQGKVPRNFPAGIETGWPGEIRARARRLHELAADLSIPENKRWYAIEQVLWPATGTIHVSVVNTKGEMSGATTTSGQAWKLPGRLGDSPIIGAGCYTDQDIGSGGRNRFGRGEHQGGGRPHHRRVDAAGYASQRSRSGDTAPHRPQLQRRHEEGSLPGHDLLHCAQGWRLCGGLVVEQ